MILLTDFEDRLLAMCVGAPVTIKLAQYVFGMWYDRSVSREEIIRAVTLLVAHDFVKWQYKKGRKRYFTKRMPLRHEGSRSITFKASKAGEAQLANPRVVV